MYCLLLFLLFGLKNTIAFESDFIVSQDGKGDYTTIQAALNAVPLNVSQRYIIYIKKGIYNEKLYFEKSNILLIGENRDSTQIVYAELRSNWRASHPDDYGSAVVNIKNDVSDLTFISLTIHNNYGGIYGNNDHQFAIRGGQGVTRIIIDNCNIIADGGDTVSLWNTEDGMYYHSNCYFEGYVDYVCPRGYCFIEESKFFGRNLTASIWHDGSGREDHRFVIKNSRFDGVKNFPLGRFHRDAQFFLIGCTFSDNMADKDIFFAPSNPPRVLKWGESRHYFYNCHGDSVDYVWHGNNLNDAKEKVLPEEITPEWTFKDLWDPKTVLRSIKIN
ncbi:MAG: hypothetical protein A2057_00850 [Ignavibacteria bacterium GWA2_35_9]|nr:MAG: hypothetical protein A2057_00850 [Ignavibacteria bacterium GWA2_35_9]